MNIENSKENLHNKLRFLRISLGYTMAEVASALDVSERYIQKIETTATSTSLDLLYKLANFYGVSISYLLHPISEFTRDQFKRSNKKVFSLLQSVTQDLYVQNEKTIDLLHGYYSKYSEFILSPSKKIAETCDVPVSLNSLQPNPILWMNEAGAKVYGQINLNNNHSSLFVTSLELYRQRVSSMFENDLPFTTCNLWVKSADNKAFYIHTLLLPIAKRKDHFEHWTIGFDLSSVKAQEKQHFDSTL